MTRDIVAEETSQAGVYRHRALSLLDRLHRDKAISFDQYAAGIHLRSAIMLETPPSEGISSYGGNIGHADGATKADRLGQRLTGFRIDYAGHVYWPGGRAWNENQRRLEDAVFAAVGVTDYTGRRRVNERDANILLQVITFTEHMPTLAAIAPKLTGFYGAKSKHAPAFSLGVISTWLGRLALHFGLSK